MKNGTISELKEVPNELIIKHFNDPKDKGAEEPSFVRNVLLPSGDIDPRERNEAMLKLDDRCDVSQVS